MSKLYRFPHLRRFDNLYKFEYRDKINEEYDELIEEFDYCELQCKDCDCETDYCNFKASDALILEVMDLIQECETLLRNSGRTDGELSELMEVHNKKDAARGYGGEK